MRFQRFDDRYIVRLESGEPLIDTLSEFLRTEQVEFANLSAAGAVSWVRLGYWNAQTRAYEYREFDEQLEDSLGTEGVPVRRVHDSASGLDLLDLPERIPYSR